jgi:hypothetical protein
MACFSERKAPSPPQPVRLSYHSVDFSAQTPCVLGGFGKVESALRNEADELAFEADRQAKRPHGKPLSVEEIRSRFPDATDGEAQAAAASKKLILPSAAATREIKVAVAAVRWLRQLTEARRRTYVDQKSTRKQPDLHRYFVLLRLASVFTSWTRMPTTTSVDGNWVTFLAALLSHCEVAKSEISHNGARKAWIEARLWAARTAEQRGAHRGDTSRRAIGRSISP